MPRQRLAAIIAALLLVLLAAFWYFSPYLALHAMRNAAQAHDAAALATHVDFPKVRESLKVQLHAMTERRARAAAGESGFAAVGAAFGAMLGNLVTDKLVDAMVTPERLADAMRQGELQLAGGREEPAAVEAESTPEKQWVFERRGLNELVAMAFDHNGKPGPRFLLAREGFASWRLVGIELPPARD